MNGWRLNLPIRNPCHRPSSTQNAITPGTTTHGLSPRFVTDIAMMTPVNPITEPTDRSIPPERMTIPAPIA